MEELPSFLDICNHPDSSASRSRNPIEIIGGIRRIWAIPDLHAR